MLKDKSIKDLVKELKKEIDTGNGFQNNLIATTNHRLGVVTKIIMKLDHKNNKLQRAIFWLSVVSVILAVAQVLFK